VSGRGWGLGCRGKRASALQLLTRAQGDHDDHPHAKHLAGEDHAEAVPGARHLVDVFFSFSSLCFFLSKGGGFAGFLAFCGEHLLSVRTVHRGHDLRPPSRHLPSASPATTKASLSCRHRWRRRRRRRRRRPVRQQQRLARLHERDHLLLRLRRERLAARRARLGLCGGQVGGVHRMGRRRVSRRLRGVFLSVRFSACVRAGWFRLCACVSF